MSTRTERAEAIRAHIAAILQADPSTAPYTVTTDARDLDKRGAGKAGAIVLVAPGPRFEFPTGGVTRLEWSVFVVANPGAAVEIWEPVDAVMDALIASRLNLVTAEPGEYARPDPAPPMTGYIVTIRDDYLN